VQVGEGEPHVLAAERGDELLQHQPCIIDVTA
jgi:hypothetical protein